MHFKHLNSKTKQNKGKALARVKGDDSLEGGADSRRVASATASHFVIVKQLMSACAWRERVVPARTGRGRGGGNALH